MTDNHGIEIEFDEVSQDYYAIWSPPVAMGAGKTKLDALLDLKEAVNSSVETLLASKCGKPQDSGGNKGKGVADSGEGIKEKARKIVALLPKRNCGKCGYANCGEFAVAVARGEASPYGCHKQPSLGDRICQIVGIEVSEKGVERGYRAGFPHSGTSQWRHHGHHFHRHHGHGGGKHAHHC